MCRCADFIIKYVLFFANLVFLLGGLALVVVGSMTINKVSDVEVFPDVLDAVPITVTVIGCIIVVISFLGCCGAIRMSCCMLSFYAVFMACLAGVKIWISTVIISNKNDLSSQVTEWLTRAFGQANREPYSVLELAFQCCGTTGAGSYGNTTLPSSCCASGDTCSLTNSYPGCITVVTDYLNTYSDAAVGVLMTVITAEVVAFVISLFLACRSRR